MHKQQKMLQINLQQKKVMCNMHNHEHMHNSEIMEFDDMPSKSYTEIVTEMNTQFADFYEKYSKVQAEIDKINIIISQAKQQCSYNIEEKAKKLLEDMMWERKKLLKERRFFYHRLKNLDLIEDSK
jgi:predicted transcriptional regulator